MIGLLRGKVVDRNGDTLILDVGGVGYQVTVTGGALSVLKDTQNQITLTIFTDVKENSISLFGFKDSAEKEVFLLLKKVKGIGSKLGLSILTAIGADGVLRLIGQNDISRLKQIPGIGAKTAERIVVELRENVREFLSESPSSGALVIETVRTAGGAQEDVVLALEKLGFPPDRARQAVSVTLSGTKITDAGELLRLALANISSAR